MDRIGLPDLGIMQGSVDFDATGFPNVAFLSQVTHGNIIYQNNMIDWKYEQRHQAQRILPFLYLGPVAAARDVAFLQRSGITMVVAVRYILVRLSDYPRLEIKYRQMRPYRQVICTWKIRSSMEILIFVIIASQLMLAY